ncbi:type II toxin-antitoxin system HicA family toxin [Neobacillus drentensis]|uniref:type II toxin-antitoxin system HicA family toxin n=1 Tax=Neobacillus drentensis TaxID=220684 RepID=UPI003002246A
MEGIRKMSVTLVIVAVIGCGLVFSSFGSALFQEGNPIPLIISAMKLHFSDSEFELFSKTEKRSRFLSENNGSSSYNVVNKYMKSKGWKFQEQMGSGLIFTKNGEDAIVVVKPYSKNYFIWEIQQRFSNNKRLTYITP